MLLMLLNAGNENIVQLSLFQETNWIHVLTFGMDTTYYWTNGRSTRMFNGVLNHFVKLRPLLFFL